MVTKFLKNYSYFYLFGDPPVFFVQILINKVPLAYIKMAPFVTMKYNTGSWIPNLTHIFLTFVICELYSISQAKESFNTIDTKTA